MSNMYFFSVFVIAVIYDPKITSGAIKNQEINADYYWGSQEFRSDKLTSDQKTMQFICFSKCGKDYICEKDECKCLKDDKPLKSSLRTSDDFQLHHDNKYTYSKEYDMIDRLRTAIKENTKPEDTQPEIQKDQTIEHPALRHHIAHFCPDLKKARACIRGCMKLGKPAFCGKDHVCYCGHRYTSHDENKKIDVNDMYAEFRDVYEKYFGPQIFENTDSNE